MSARDEQQAAIVDATCRLAGAAEVVDGFRRGPDISAAALADHQAWLHDTHLRRLIAAVDAYLGPRGAQ